MQNRIRFWNRPPEALPEASHFAKAASDLAVKLVEAEDEIEILRKHLHRQARTIGELQEALERRTSPVWMMLAGGLVVWFVVFFAAWME